MANVLILQLNANPTNFQFLDLRFYRVPDDGYAYPIFRQFVTNEVPPGFQIRIGSTIADTLYNLVGSLMFFNSDPNVNLSIASVLPELNQIVFEFNDYQDYDYFEIFGNDVDYTILYASSTPPVYLPELPELIVKDFSISIIDAYENSLPMLVELPAAGACEITWDGGDDLFAETFASELKFNMLVPDFSDAHFLHLFTGDENRYRVELNAIDYDENSQLVWAGFLLPDQYDEPYTNNNLFVDFVATDNLGTLKGKYFPKWYYYNRFPIAELLGMILEMTGLNQTILVRPSVVPDFFRYKWWHINIDLNAYIDGEKKGDLHKILTDVLKANCLTLKNYRGYWFIEGLTRKKDSVGVMLQFDLKGRYLGEMNFTKRKIVPLIQSESANITAITPYKKITFDVKVKGNKNMFRDDIVGIEEKDIFYNYYPWFVQEANPNTNCGDRSFLHWDNNFSQLIRYNWFGLNRVNYRFDNATNPGTYNATEAQALVSYIECPDKVFVKPGILYEFEMEFFAEQLSSSGTVTSGEFYDRRIPFQFFLNGVEFISNRPSFPQSSRYKWQVVNDNLDGTPGTKFKNKYEFRVDVSGELSLRIMAPIGDHGDFTFMTFTKLDVKIVEDYDITENISAVRNINYTKELNYDVNLTCSPDKSVDNSFGFGLPIDSAYIKTIRSNVIAAPVSFTATHFFAPDTYLDLVCTGVEISYETYQLLFQKGFRKACFLLMNNDDTVAFDNMYGSVSDSLEKRAVWLTSFEGYPAIPKNYFPVPSLVGVVDIQVMHVKYGPEDYTQRLKWKLFGNSIVNEFNKTVVNAIYSVTGEQRYMLECDLLQLCFPDDLILFDFAEEERDFIPTRISIDLYGGKTRVTATESKYKVFTDLIYE